MMHKSKTGFNFYGFGGIGGTVYDTKVNALGADNNKYTQFATVNGDVYKNRKDTKKQLKDILF